MTKRLAVTWLLGSVASLWIGLATAEPQVESTSSPTAASSPAEGPKARCPGKTDRSCAAWWAPWQVWEIFEQVRLNADLVVLSACDTSLGEERGGEGLIGLTRAFQYAGARSVMASLWNVNDQATAELMIRFYKHLRAGLPKDQALQAAQRELIAGPIEITSDTGERVLKDYSAPYYWAGFQLYGDWQ